MQANVLQEGCIMAIITTSFIVTETTNFINKFSNRSFDEMSFDSRVEINFMASVSGYDIWEVKHYRPEIVITAWSNCTLKGEYFLQDWDSIYGTIMGNTQEDAHNDPCPETFAAYAEAKAFFHKS